MIITNKYNLPISIYNAVSKHFHKKSDYSVTELLAPTQQTLLKNKHDAEITEDCSERIWALMGSAVHEVLQSGADKNTLTEENLKIDVLGKTISGSPDFFDGSLIQDYKFTSAWTVVYGDRNEEHEAQLNCYAYLYSCHGFKIEKLQIVYILRDWSKTKAAHENNYPQSQVIVKDFSLWEKNKQALYISDRVQALIKAEKGIVSPCSPAEQWRTADVYAVMKMGRKSAVKLFEKEAEAETFAMEKGKGHSIIKRPGEPKRCYEYCSAREFCAQAKSEEEK